MQATGSIGPRGELSIKVFRGPRLHDKQNRLSLLLVLAAAFPWPWLEREVVLWRLRNLPHLWTGLRHAMLAKLFGLPHFAGTLCLRVIRKDGSVVNLGLASVRIVTDAGAVFLVDNLRASISNIANMKYHGLGTGNTAAAVGDTTLQTEATTEYNPNSTRATGSQTNNGTKVYRTVGSNTVDASLLAVEWGLFTQAATGGGTMLDRVVFALVSLANGDTLQTTFDFTINSGS